MSNHHLKADSQMLQPRPLAELNNLTSVWTRHREVAAARVAQLEQAIGRALLNGNGEQVKTELAEQRARVGECDLVLMEVARQMPAAKAAELRSRAKTVQAEERRLRAELEALRAEISPLLAELKRLNGCEYVPARPGLRGEGLAWTAELERAVMNAGDKAADLLSQAETMEKQLNLEVA